ncbi:diacylglycerol/lipid kinase family protein [Pseudoroseomonas globiformis]|uniref:Diacylglycerol/lipid kinase family protein n=1 Tax=Teichococcus globiformis TaxID=2307229 RepID=A0ABV7G7E5_9PROT
MRTVLVFNPSAGEGEQPVQALTHELAAGGLTVAAFPSKEIVQALGEPADLVIVAGGDGTVTETALAMSGSSVPLAILPCGTANNLARALGGWSDAAALAAGWRDAASRPLSIADMRCGTEHRSFIEAVGFGAFAKAVRIADRTGLKGVEAGRAAFAAALREAAPLDLRLILDGTEHRTSTLLLEIMAVPQFGPRLTLAADLRAGEGQVAVVSLAPARRAEMEVWLERPDAAPAPVECRLASHVQVDWDGGALRVDDAHMTIGAPCRLEVSLQEKTLRLMTPRETEMRCDR